MYSRIVLIFILFVNVTFTFAQLDNTSGRGGGGGSPIWGSSPIYSEPSPLNTDPNWGTLPSRQGQTDMWGRGNTGSSRNSQTASRGRYRDAYGNYLLTDPNGNIIYDAQGQAVQDTALNMQLGLAGNDPASLPNPPDDPADVPLDNGVLILLIIALGFGYRKYPRIITQQ